MNPKQFLAPLLIIIFLFAPVSIVYANTLSCSVTTAAACVGTVIWRMSGATNAHAELPGQTTAAYDNNVVCCTGVTGLGNACSGTFATVINLTAVTNSHVSQASAAPYTTPACISVPSGGTVSVGYATDCLAAGFHTTLGSMSGVTNTHVGDAMAYTTKICASATAAVAQTLTFSISDDSIGFGTLLSGAGRWATGNNIGSANETVAHTIDAATNALYGYTITVQGATLTSGANTITAIGGTSAPSAPGSEQYGLRITASGGTGLVSAPYNHMSNYAYGATATTPHTIASAATGDNVTTTYSIRYLSNISAATESGNYTAIMTYIITANF